MAPKILLETPLFKMGEKQSFETIEEYILSISRSKSKSQRRSRSRSRSRSESRSISRSRSRSRHRNANLEYLKKHYFNENKKEAESRYEDLLDKGCAFLCPTLRYKLEYKEEIYDKLRLETNIKDKPLAVLIKANYKNKNKPWIKIFWGFKNDPVILILNSVGNSEDNTIFVSCKELRKQ